MSWGEFLERAQWRHLTGCLTWGLPFSVNTARIQNEEEYNVNKVNHGEATLTGITTAARSHYIKPSPTRWFSQ